MIKYLRNLENHKLLSLAFDIEGNNYKFNSHQLIKELRCRIDKNLTNVNNITIKELSHQQIVGILSYSKLQWAYEYDRDDIHNDINPYNVVLELIYRIQYPEKFST